MEKEPRNADGLTKVRKAPLLTDRKEKGPEFLELNTAHNLNEFRKGFISRASRKEHRHAHILNLALCNLEQRIG